ncbi:type II toxin-antitoxin system RelB/DinJ family antitoxin [Anaerococcus sp. AGMB00486]|uniref:Type II toxin-antitoxin system RelB/DinJ family antitoxin n=1 Tax=Anaerococcus faecalis TaxID=2742993 RepID=A0ABX2NCU3_9FIRM|nr:MULTISPECIES: type II toxin-antitoxin system RelB/DinJ family antitoxin [Anaerococcus]MDY3007308.1 type II toxin-antitoxin system RelB/DinJ family antitoxin [Anaerococcus porci]NVF12545.1 type II toxin-antitoxin system RelB/DinJ family antitoxin [Anaerococcus faecalis]
MAKSANLNIRMKPEIKDKAEEILNALGIPPSNAVDMFYRQIILNKGLPFNVKLPDAKLVDISDISKDELNKTLMEGIQDLKDGKFENVDDAFQSIYEQI